jgi:hypothetical protein
MQFLILDASLYYYASAPLINNGIFSVVLPPLWLDSGFDAVHTEHEHSVGTETGIE